MNQHLLIELYQNAYDELPTSDWLQAFSVLSESYQQEIWDYIGEDSERRDDERKAESISRLESKIGDTNRKTVLRWMTQDEIDHSNPNIQDLEQWVWAQGVLFTPYGKALVKELAAIWNIKG